MPIYCNSDACQCPSHLSTVSGACVCCVSSRSRCQVPGRLRIEISQTHEAIVLTFDWLGDFLFVPIFIRIVRAFLVEEQKIVKKVLKQQKETKAK
jgi:hypothetical protein